MIELKHIGKVYHAKGGDLEALKDINLSIEEGEIYGIIGLSGAGKSTLVRCINMLEQPTSGEVIVDGRDMTKLSKMELRKARQEIGMIFQHFNLLSSRTVYDNIAFPLEIQGKSRDEIRKKVEPLLISSVLRTAATIILPSCRAARNSASVLPAPLLPILRCFFVTKLQAPLIPRRRNLFWNSCGTSINGFISRLS